MVLTRIESGAHKSGYSASISPQLTADLRQWVAFTARRKRPVVANTAIARELAGWCWSLAVMDD